MSGKRELGPEITPTDYTTEKMELTRSLREEMNQREFFASSGYIYVERTIEDAQKLDLAALISPKSLEDGTADYLRGRLAGYNLILSQRQKNNSAIESITENLETIRLHEEQE